MQWSKRPVPFDHNNKVTPTLYNLGRWRCKETAQKASKIFEFHISFTLQLLLSSCCSFLVWQSPITFSKSKKRILIVIYVILFHRERQVKSGYQIERKPRSLKYKNVRDKKCQLHVWYLKIKELGREYL